MTNALTVDLGRDVSALLVENVISPPSASAKSISGVYIGPTMGDSSRSSPMANCRLNFFFSCVAPCSVAAARPQHIKAASSAENPREAIRWNMCARGRTLVLRRDRECQLPAAGADAPPEIVFMEVLVKIPVIHFEAERVRKLPT